MLLLALVIALLFGSWPNEPHNVARFRTRYWKYDVLIQKSGKWEYTVKFFRFHEKPKIKMDYLVVKVCDNKVSALFVLWLICWRLQKKIDTLKVVKSAKEGEVCELHDLLVKVIRATSKTHVLVEDLNDCGHRMVVSIKELKKWW